MASAPAPTPVAKVTTAASGPAIIGAYKGTNITAGNDANIQAQEAAIDAKSTPTASPAVQTGAKATLAATTSSTPSGGSTTSPTLVTSSASRTNYANNTTSLNKSLANVNANPNVSVVDYLNKAGMPSDYSSRAVLAAKSGIPNYSGSASQNLQLLSLLQNGAGPASGDNNTKSAQPPMNGTTQPVAAPASITPAGDTSTPSVNTADGTSAVTTDSTIPVSNPDGTTTDANDITSGLPPSVASAFKDALTQQQQNIDQAQTTLTQAKATMTSDPAAIAAASQIESQYSTLIDAMNAKNNIVLGSYRTNAARNGSLQYANDMETNFMSEEMDAASMRLGDLVTKEQELILKSNTAYQNADVKAFNDAQTAVEKATNDKQTTLGKLLTATNNQVKAVQAQQKIDAAAKKQVLTTDVTTSAKIAAGMAQQIADSGTTDQTTIDKYVQDMAANNGITNVDILKSALVTAQQTATKATLGNENIQSEIVKRGSTGSNSSTTKGGGTDGGYKYSANDVSTYSNLMNQGGTVNGTSYAARGKDGFVDPGTYSASYEDWIKNGGTPTGFAKKFPVKGNINPSSYSELPAAIQPKAAASATTPQYQA